MGASMFHTVLLRSDGTVVAFSKRDAGQCLVPDLPDELTYGHAEVVLSLTTSSQVDGFFVFRCGDVVGNDICRLELPPTATVAVLQKRLVSALARHYGNPKIVTESGRLLGDL